MTEVRPDRVECILGQGHVVLGGGLGGARISEDAAGFVRDLCLGVIQEFADNWSAVAQAVWDVVYNIGVATRDLHTSEGDVTVEELVAGTWSVVALRHSGICLRLKSRLNELGFAPPPS